jgi:hypothetical protein
MVIMTDGFLPSSGVVGALSAVLVEDMTERWWRQQTSYAARSYLSKAPASVWDLSGTYTLVEAQIMVQFSCHS